MTLLDGRYALDEQIGAGGFCEVWRATDTLLTRPVAVKLLHAGYAYQPEVQARFKAEARLAGCLSHQNIARVYDYGAPDRGVSYLVMELIEGPSLAGVLDGGSLGAARTLDIVAQVAAGLQVAHSAGLVHRDIKPTNIMFTSDGTARITDFGIAHEVGSAPLTATGIVLGTPGYIAPERVAGAQGGPASDLYALGIVAYECLAGAPPFSGPPLEVAIAHRDRPLPPLPRPLSAEVAAFVMLLTAKNPAYRPASAGEVANQARWLRARLLSGSAGAQPDAARPIAATAPLPIAEARESHDQGYVQSRTRAKPPGRRRIAGVAAPIALAVLSCLALLVIVGVAFASHSPQAAAPAKSPSTGSQAANDGNAAAPARHPAPKPHKKPGPGPGTGKGHGHENGHGHGHENG